MTILFDELKERLKRVEETILLEILNISSEEIVDRFEDIIEDHFEELASEFEDEEEELSSED